MSVSEYITITKVIKHQIFRITGLEKCSQNNGLLAYDKMTKIHEWGKWGIHPPSLKCTLFIFQCRVDSTIWMVVILNRTSLCWKETLHTSREGQRLIWPRDCGMPPLPTWQFPILWLYFVTATCAGLGTQGIRKRVRYKWCGYVDKVSLGHNQDPSFCNPPMSNSKKILSCISTHDPRLQLSRHLPSPPWLALKDVCFLFIFLIDLFLSWSISLLVSIVIFSH